MTKTMTIKSNGRIEFGEVPTRKAGKKYKKFITNSFARQLPKLVFHSLGREDGGSLQLLGLYSEYSDFFEIAEVYFRSKKNPATLPAEELRRLNLLYVYFEELMFNGFDLLIIQAFADNYDFDGLEAFLNEQEIKPGSLLYDFSHAIYATHEPDDAADLNSYYLKMKEIAEDYPWFIHSRILIAASRYGRSLNRMLWYSQREDDETKQVVRDIKELIKAGYQLKLKKGRIRGKIYSGVIEGYEKEVRELYNEVYIKIGEILLAIRAFKKYGSKLDQVITKISERYGADFGSFKMKIDETVTFIYENVDKKPTWIASNLFAKSLGTSVYALRDHLKLYNRAALTAFIMDIDKENKDGRKNASVK
jgi:hypothetical protein